MSTLAELQSEITALKVDVARLKEDAALFFIVHRDEDGSVSDTQLRCWMLHCEQIDLRMRDSTECRGMIGVEPDGPYVSLWGDDNRARMIMKVRNNAGQLDIFDDQLNPVAQMYAGDGGHGHVTVLSPGGIPRAVMKAMDTGGAVSVVNEEGRARAVLMSNKDKGELGVIQNEHAQVRILSGENGGSVITFNEKGEKGCAMVTGPTGNSFTAWGPEKTPAASLVATAVGNTINLGDITEGKPSIQLLDLPGLGGNIYVRDKDGNQVVAISTEETGGDISVCAPGKDATQAKLHIHNGGGMVSTTRAESPSAAIITASETGGLFVARGEDDRSAALQVAGTGGSVTISKGQHMQLFAGIGDDKESGAIMLTNPDNTSAVNLFSSKIGGTLLMGGIDGTIQVGCSGTDNGGQLTMFSELGVERASVVSKGDGGGLHLKWGGTTGLIAAATERGGLVLTHGADGAIVDSLPDRESLEEGWEAPPEEPE